MNRRGIHVYSAECQSIQITLAEARVQDTLEQLEGRAPAERAALFDQLKSLIASLKDLQDKLGNCIVNSNQVVGLFGGTATIVIQNHQGLGNIACSTLLDSTRTKFSLTFFPPNSYVVGSGITLTVTKTSGGSGSYANGHISLPQLKLHFAVSGTIVGAADLTLTLSTDGPGGSPVNPEPLGAVTFVGSGPLGGGGPLNGQICNLTITGKIFPAT
jgi:hypothetical protein